MQILTRVSIDTMIVKVKAFFIVRMSDTDELKNYYRQCISYENLKVKNVYF